jgi:hypothetical protein
MTQWIFGLLGVTVTLAIFTGTAIFHMGRLSQRVHELEQWRIRQHHDMHEISEILTGVGAEIKRLATIIEERTERRVDPRLRTS